MIHKLSSGLLERAIEIGCARRGNKNNPVTSPKMNPTQTGRDRDVLAAKAEVALADLLGVEVDDGIYEGPDQGWDLQCDGRTIDVKSTFHRHGRLFFNTTSKFTADLAVLAVPAGFDQINFVGWITREEFIQQHYTANLGYGNRVVMDQSSLHSMSIFPCKLKDKGS